MAKGKKQQQQKTGGEQLDVVDPVANDGVTGEQEEGTILNDDVSDDEDKNAAKDQKDEEPVKNEDPVEKEESQNEDKKDEKKELESELKEEQKDADVKSSEVKSDIPPPTYTEESAKTEETKSSKIEDEAPVPPPKPARPLSPREESKKNLKDAFPTIEDSIIESILIASSFKLEPAFNALIYLSDPGAMKFNEVPVVDEAPTPRRQLTQLEQDEMLAKRLDEEYNKSQRRERRRRQQQQQQQYPGEGSQGSSYRPSRRQDGQGRPISEDEDDDVLTNFVEKDLPQIKEQFSKNIEETKTKFNSWVSGWKKQYQATSEEWQQRNKSPFGGQPGTGGLGGQQQPISQQRRKYEFEEDPEEVDVREFHGISLGKDDVDDEGESGNGNGNKPKLPNRNRAQSTDLYGTPKHGGGSNINSIGNTSTGKKWEPLQSKKPDPIKLDNNVDDDDDFLLSDDEDFGKK